MSKFYQHVEPGDNQGKITKLKYIDDISDDELILYCFEDGTKCSSEYIGTVEETEETIKNKVMVELTGPDNAWTFMKKEVIAETSKMVRNEMTGEYFEIVGPDVEMDGAPGGQNRSIKKMGKNTTRIEVTQPRRLTRYHKEEDSLYMLSNNPHLEAGVEPVQPVIKTQPKPQPKKVEEPIQTIEKEDLSVLNAEEVVETISNQQASQLQAVITEPVYVNVTECKQKLEFNMEKLSSEIRSFVFNFNGSRIEVPYTEMLQLVMDKDMLLNPQPMIVEEPIGEPICSIDEDPLIKNMIDKAKKKVCSINMNLKLELPPKEVYETIKAVYPDGMTDSFVNSLTERIPTGSLKESLASGLTVYYDGVKQEKKEKTEKKDKSQVDFNTKI